MFHFIRAFFDFGFEFNDMILFTGLEIYSPEHFIYSSTVRTQRAKHTKHLSTDI